MSLCEYEKQSYFNCLYGNNAYLYGNTGLPLQQSPVKRSANSFYHFFFFLWFHLSKYFTWSDQELCTKLFLLSIVSFTEFQK